MIKLVAFDWNGTIFADTNAILHGANEVLKLLGLKPVSLKNFQKHFDVPVTKTYLALGISEKMLKSRTSEITQTFHSSYELRAAKVRTRAFAKQLLGWLSDNHINSIIFSNHIDEPIKKQLKRLKIEKYFSRVLANSHFESALQGRNKQGKLKNYLDDHNLLTSEVLIIGDSIEEVEIGQKLSITTVAVTQGNCSIARLKALKPDYLTHSLKEVTNIIKKINYQ